MTIGQGQLAEVVDQARHGRGLAHELAGDHAVARVHGVAQAQLKRVDAEAPGQHIHLGFVPEAGLDRAETAHGAVGHVVGAGVAGPDLHVRHPVWARREHRGVRADRGRARGVGAAVQHDRRPDEDQVAFPVRTMRVPHQGGVAVDVAGEGLLAPVPHLHRATRPQGQNTAVDLHGEIFAGAESAPHARQPQADFLSRQAQALANLVEVDVQPLGRDPEIDPALAVRDREAGFRAQRRLILLPDLVVGVDHHFRVRMGVAPADHLVAERFASAERSHRVGQRIQRLVFDGDRRAGRARLLGMLGGDDGDRLARIANLLAGANQHRLVAHLLPVEPVCRELFRSDDRAHARHRLRPGRIDGADERMRVRAAQSLAVEHPRRDQVACEVEAAGNLVLPIWPRNRLADAASCSGGFKQGWAP